MAASSAASGMATNTPTRKRWAREFGSSAPSGRGGRTRVLAVVLTVPPMVPADVGVTWSAGVASAAWTVSGEVVIVLLWNSAKRTGAFVRLRNRSLRNRRLGKAWRVNSCKWAYEFRMRPLTDVSY